MNRSGSMGGLENDTVGGFNAFIDKQRQLAGETIVTAVLFDDKYEILWNGITTNNVRLTDKDYFVRGGTALLDAVGKTILDVGYRLSNANEDERPGKVIFVITTDGLENASREFTYNKIKDLIKHQQEKYHWEFIFLGANIDAIKVADNIGIDLNNTFKFEASKTGVEIMYQMACDAVLEKRQNIKN
ncbi:VWA domain-containing protein [Metabacillus bambusae]|uniref:VWA domain-containing protein n=1 Tax=Metabacillus bambusae TaxID=2795218 RepID=A0ABS3MWN3_9BACI|nr:VWA domain-containing protein [Metabacillus bambusae]MBO1510083.1 VWA domain-containing protein [Metabacillus bambusae]